MCRLRLHLTRLACVLLLAAGTGCQSTRSFSIDSNSRVPWFGLNLSLPKPSARRKTLETISDNAPEKPAVEVADLRTPEPEPASLRTRLPRWLGGTPAGIPLPQDAPNADPEQLVQLEGPREAFR